MNGRYEKVKSVLGDGEGAGSRERATRENRAGAACIPARYMDIWFLYRPYYSSRLPACLPDDGPDLTGQAGRTDDGLKCSMMPTCGVLAHSGPELHEKYLTRTRPHDTTTCTSKRISGVHINHILVHSSNNGSPGDPSPSSSTFLAGRVQYWILVQQPWK